MTAEQEPSGIFLYPELNPIIFEILTQYPDAAEMIRSIMAHPAYDQDVALLAGGLKRLQKRLDNN